MSTIAADKIVRTAHITETLMFGIATRCFDVSIILVIRAMLSCGVSFFSSIVYLNKAIYIVNHISDNKKADSRDVALH